MKSFIPAMLLCLFCSAASAQFKMIAESEPFDEPREGYCKLLQLSNGNTAFLVAWKKGLTVKIYDKTYKLRVENPIEAPTGKISVIETIFEIRGDIVFFYRSEENDMDILNRVIIDGQKGTLRKMDKVASMPSLTRRQYYGKGLDNAPLQHSFNVRKDPTDQYYALTICNSYAENGKQVEMVFFGSENKEIARAFYAAPDKYKFIQYVDMVVIGGQKAVVLGYAGNTTRQKNRDGELVIATLDSGSNKVELTELDISKEIVVEGGITRYNPVTKNVVLLAAVKQPKDDGYTPIVAFVNPFDRAITNIFTVFPERANGKSEEIFGKKNGFLGMPQNMFIDNLGDISIVFEEMVVYSGSSGSSTVLGNLAVARFDPNGKESGGCLIPKSIALYNGLRTFYHSELEGEATALTSGNQFKHFAYLNGMNGKDYILFNDIEENGEAISKGKKPKKIIGLGGCDAFYFSLTEDDALPERHFLFGNPENKKEHQLAAFGISDYNRSKNIYTTLQLDKEGRSKQVKIVWMQP